MPIQVLMPALSPTMTEGTLARWLKKEGDAIAAGEVIAEIETDKAIMEVEAVDEGVLGRILVTEGTEAVAVNTPIALLLEEGEDPAVLERMASATPAVPQKPVTAAVVAPAVAPAAVPKPSPSRSGAKSGNRVFASPLARRLAAEANLDLQEVTGSGPNGRIIKRDVEAAIADMAARRVAATPVAPSMPEPVPTAVAIAAGYRDVPHSTMRRIIAERLTASKRDIPHYYLTIDCDVDAIRDVRRKLNESAPAGEGAYKLSLNDFVVRAAALALRRHPECNATWTDNALRLYENVDISVAVATSNGLITPVVRDAHRKGLAMIANDIQALAAKARDGKLMPEEYQGGGFTISNLGMYGIREFAAIINPPQTCILAVGAAESRPVVKDGALAIATMMTCTMSADHRAVDGAVGAQFLATFKSLIENPLTMLL